MHRTLCGTARDFSTPLGCQPLGWQVTSRNQLIYIYKPVHNNVHTPTHRHIQRQPMVSYVFPHSADDASADAHCTVVNEVVVIAVITTHISSGTGRKQIFTTALLHAVLQHRKEKMASGSLRWHTEGAHPWVSTFAFVGGRIRKVVTFTAGNG